MSAARRAVVIGGGIAGCTVALELARAEVPAALIEPRAAIGGATGAAAGILAPQFETDPEDDALFPLLLESRRGYPGFVHAVERASGRDLDFREDGLVIANLGAAETEAAERAAERYRAHGLAGVVRDAKGGEWLVPGLGPVDSVLWLPDEAAIDAQALAPALERAVAVAGVEVRRDRAIGLVTRAGAVRGVALETGGVLACDLVFLAAGAWSDDVLDPDRKARVRPVRGQMLRFRGLVPALVRQVADHAGCYALPRADGSVVVGSTMEEAGYEERTTGGGLEAIRSRAFGWLPGLRDASLVETWAGLRPFTPDGLPMLGADPEVDGLHHATGYGRNGILIAPHAAALVVAAALRERPGTALLDALSPFDPARLA